MWYIGQEIVCIKTHSKNKIKRGQIFIIKGLRKSECKCNEIEIDVGIPTEGGYCKCLRCGYKAKHRVSAWWFSETNFAPLEYNANAIKELIEQPIVIEK